MPNVRENIAFIEFTRTFRNYDLNVPEIYGVSEDLKYYIEEDLGDVTLYSLSGSIKNSDILRMYEGALAGLLRFQIEMKDKIDYDLCYETKVFDKIQLAADLAKFDKYYMKQFGIVIDEKLTETALLTVCKEFLSEDNSFFTYRDFQPRNVMVKDDQLYFIDYQSGRKGPLLYDLVSFLYSGSITLNEQGSTSASRSDSSMRVPSSKAISRRQKSARPAGSRNSSRSMGLSGERRRTASTRASSSFTLNGFTT
jgi:aminoglycoside/choline kinase family phosphotransferase